MMSLSLPLEDDASQVVEQQSSTTAAADVPVLAAAAAAAAAATSAPTQLALGVGTSTAATATIPTVGDVNGEMVGSVAAAADGGGDNDQKNNNNNNNNSHNGIQNEIGETGVGKRRFFPRVKHLINNKEWEPFLTDLLDTVGEAGAPQVAAASHKPSNAWYKAFDLVYGGVASDYSVPTGKNRYAKFKDKIVEVWTALEATQGSSESDDIRDRSCRTKAMAQLAMYRQACEESIKVAALKEEATAAAVVVAGSEAVVVADEGIRIAPAGEKNKSSGLSSKRALFGLGQWSGLDEVKTLAKLPQPLQSLMNLRQLGREVTKGTPGRTVDAAEHSQSTDVAYIEALNDYLAADLTMLDKDTIYDRAMCMALLHRYASADEEKAKIGEGYQVAVDKYIQMLGARRR